MSFSVKQLREVAQLARLELSEADAALYSRNLTDIMDMVEQLSAADTESISPMAHPLDLAQRLRPDAVTEINQRETFQALAPAIEDGHYAVPKVIE